MNLPPTKRASQILIALSAWAFVSAIASLLIFKIVYISALPTSLPNLTNDINNIQDFVVLKKISLLLAESVTTQKETGWLIASWGLWFVATWSAIFGVTTMLLYRQLTKTNPTEEQCSKETILDLALTGKLELWKAFWVFYIALPAVASLTVYQILAILRRTHVIEPTKVADLILTPLAYSAVLVIFLGAAIVVWRCSTNTPSITWRYLVRGSIILFTVIPLAKSAILLGHYLR